MTSPTAAVQDNPLSFESSLKELERLVAELEKNDVSLENQLKAFEKGVALSRECMKRLEEVERRVEVLMQSSDGKISSSPFNSATSEG